jgi:uncharacterized protein (TIGR02270 family)
METSPRDFLMQMYLEHLEDAAFLYDQRHALMADADLPWVRLQDFEERLEAHIDALVIGGELALEVCRSRAAEGEAAELYAAVCVFCRNKGSHLLGEVWRVLDFADRAKVRAVTEALKFELPNEWRAPCEQALMRADDQLVPILAVVCASRSISVGDRLLARLAARPPLVQPLTIWALVRTGTAAEFAVPMLAQYCSHADVAVRASALTGLLRFDDRRTLRSFYLAAQTEDWPQLALGLGGDRSAATGLRQRAESGRATHDTLLALGLLGDLSTVRVLCQCLSNEELSGIASLALHWITGARLFGEEFIPEEADELELTESELIAFRDRAELPKRADGKPFGHAVQRLTTDAAQWNAWLEANARRFDPSVRYRKGKPYSVTAVLHCLVDESTPGRLRQLAYEELVIRFGCPVPFEADWRVADQKSVLREIGRWAMTDGERFEIGSWR